MADQLGKLFKGALGLIRTARETEFDSTDSVTSDGINQQTNHVNHLDEKINQMNHQMNPPVNHRLNISRTLNEGKANEGKANEEQNQAPFESVLNNRTVPANIEHSGAEHSSVELNSSNSPTIDHQSFGRHSTSRTCQTDDLGPSPAKKARTIEISIPEQFHSTKLTKIIKLNRDSPSDWLLIGRVTAKSFLEIYSGPESNGGCFSFQFKDNSGQIHVSVSSDSQSDRLTRLYDLLVIDKCYLITKGTIQRTNRRYGRRTSHYCEIALDDHSIIEQTDDIDAISAFVHSVADSCIPPIGFNFAKLDRIANHSSGIVLDVIGICTGIEETCYFQTKTNGPALRKSVFLVDETKTQILLKLFDKQAHSFRGRPNDVIVLRDVLISDFNSLMPTSCTLLEVNRETAETDRLRQWWSENATTVQLADKPLITGWSSLSSISLDEVKRHGCVKIQAKATIIKIGGFRHF